MNKLTLKKINSGNHLILNRRDIYRYERKKRGLDYKTNQRKKDYMTPFNISSGKINKIVFENNFTQYYLEINLRILRYNVLDKNTVNTESYLEAKIFETPKDFLGKVEAPISLKTNEIEQIKKMTSVERSKYFKNNYSNTINEKSDILLNKALQKVI